MSRSANHLLQKLPVLYRKALLAGAEEVTLPVGTIIFEAGRRPEYAHFVLSGSISLIALLKSGDGLDVFSVGCEGLVEAVHLLGASTSPARAIVQMESRAVRLRFDDLQRQLLEYRPLRLLITGYVQTRTFILEQLSVCNRHHEVEARLARWLLMMQDRLESKSFPVTQEQLAELLGTRRTTVTHAARRLQQAGIIEYTRGQMRILDRKGLEQRACECYAIVRRLANAPSA